MNFYPAAVYVEPESKGLFDYNNRSEKVSNQESVIGRSSLYGGWCDGKIESSSFAGFNKSAINTFLTVPESMR